MKRITFLTLVILLATNASYAADPAAAKAAAKSILENGWNKTAAARKLVDSEFTSTEAKSPNDLYLLAAHWMALANQNRYEESLISLNAFLKNKPDSLPALQAKVFIHTVMKHPKEAMDAAEALAKALAEQNSRPLTAAQAEAVEFLGCFAGYLQAPLANVADQSERKKFEVRLLNGFDEPQQKFFAQGKEAVFAKLAQLQTTAAEEVEEAKEAAAAAKEQKLEDAEQERQKLAADAKELAEREAKAAEQLRQTLDGLNQQLAAANGNINQLQIQKTRFITQLTRDQANAQRAQQQAAQGQNDQRLQFEARQAQNTLQGSQRQVDNVDRQLMSAQALANNLQQRIQAAQANGAKQGKAFDTQRQGLEANSKKNEGRQKRAAGAKDKSAAKANASEIQIRAFSTYAKLPLEELRASLLVNVQ